MEVTVLEATRPPAKPVLAIHADSVHRQAKLEVNRPFVIPQTFSTSCSVQVSLFQQLASETLRLEAKPEAVCSIPVKRPDGTMTQVQLRLRRTHETSELPKIGDLTKPCDLGVTSDYLERHQLQGRIGTLIRDVLREQPPDPYKYMLDLLKKSKAADAPSEPTAIVEASTQKPVEVKAATAEKPMDPRPPADPKPANARPAKKNSDMKVSNNRAEACQLAYHAIRLVLGAPKCLEAGREAPPKEVVAVGGESNSAVRQEARASLALVMQAVSVTTSPEFVASLAMRVRAASYAGACKLISANPDWDTSESLER